ncbi:tetratricopeptide repeat protein [Desulfocicer niacini]
MKKIFNLSNLFTVILIGFILFQFYISNLDGSKMILQGDTQLFHSEYDGALASFSAALEEIKRSGTAFFFDKGYTIDKMQNRLKAWHGMGSAYAGLKNYEKAHEYFTRVLQENPFYIKSRAKRASIAYNLKNYQGAVSDYSDILSSAPKDFYSLYHRGNAYLQLQAYEKAIVDYNQAVSLGANGPPRPETLYITNTLARLLATCPQKSLRNGSRAVELSEKIILTAKKNFTTPQGILALAWFKDTLAAALAQAGQFEKAVETMEDAISLMKKSQASPQTVNTLWDHLVLFQERKTLTEEMDPMVFH